MPMRYADPETVLAALKIKGTDAAAIKRVTDLENELAATFDGMIGRSFGEAAVPQTRTVAGYGSDVLVLTDGVRVVSGVAMGGVTLAPADYALGYVDRDGIAYGLSLTSGTWVGPVAVTATWADQSVEAVPVDVRGALNTLTEKEYRRRTTGEAEIVGPDDNTVPLPRGWSDPMVKAALARYRVVQVIV